MARMRPRDPLPGHPPVHRRHRAGRGWLIALAVVVAVVLLIRWPGSLVATHLANRQLAALPDYTGHVDDVSLALWRGAVDVDELVLHERDHTDDLPVVHVPHASLRLAPGAFFHGRIGGSVTIEHPEFAIVKRQQPGAAAAVQKAKTETKQKAQQLRRWQDVLREAFPLELKRLELTDGRVRFIDRSHQPQVDVALEQIHLTVTGLRNEPEGEALSTHADVEAHIKGGGRLTVRVAANPVAEKPRFHAALQLRQLDLPAFNSFLLAYADADVSRGTFDLDLEADAKGGGYSGYVKPFFKDLDFKNPSDKDKNAVQKLKETVVAAAASLLKNDEDKQVATKAPFSGNFDNNDVDLWTTIANLLRNAFVQAIREGFEGRTPSR